MIDMTVTDGAVADPAALARALRPALSVHPVPQGDPRTRGLVMEVHGQAAGRSRLGAVSPALVQIFERCTGEPDAIYVVAVNETPPGETDHFQMRPHLDRRWRPEGFVGGPPRFTTVVFLDFPPTAIGGELVVFPADAFAGGAAVPRDGARRTVATRGGTLVAPCPGRSCKLAGRLPHAVLGYAAPGHASWRMAAVVAEFPRL